MNNIKISVIICSYNREKYIYNVLKSVAENDYTVENYEVVLINNNSTDNTETECLRFQNDFPRMKFEYFIERNQGLSFARNRGIKEAKGDILIYVDDDATVNSEYLKTYANFFDQNPKISAAGGPIIPVYESEEPAWFSHYTKTVLTGYKYHGDKEKEFTAGQYPGGGNAAYRKKVFEEVGFYNVELGRKGKSLVGSEEKDIFDKMVSAGMKFYYLPNAILYHIIPPAKLTVDYLKRLSCSIGEGERMRTLGISRAKYLKRLFKESVNWAATIVFYILFLLSFAPQKGWYLILFRYYVSKGLLAG
ncbi:MAG: glycosyltransferase [Bacteroidales bacterium]|jgi:glycosyltransferase involved in cell wall biosynthesis|nr:glycosyltransferase [Bacteroidales bacterium]